MWLSSITKRTMNKIQSIALIGWSVLMNVCVTCNAATGLDAHGQLQAVIASLDTDFAFTRLDNGVQLRIHDVVKNIVFYGPDTVRVNSNNGSVFTTQPSLVVIEKPAKVAFTVQQSPESLFIVSKKLRITVLRKTGALTFAKANGELLYQEQGDQPQLI